MVDVGKRGGMHTSAMLTDMSVPLAWSAGNALEVLEAVDYFQNPATRHPRLNEVALALGEALLVQSGMHPDAHSARAALERVRDNGTALECWARSIEAMGGSPRVTEKPPRNFVPGIGCSGMASRHHRTGTLTGSRRFAERA